MSMTVNIGGVEKSVAGVYCNIGGVWKTASAVKCNVGGVWKDGYSSGIGGIDAYTKLMLHMNGTNGSTTFADEIGHAFTANGNAQISTAQSKFGGAAAYFDGTGDWIDTPDSADFAFGADDFTIDFWVKRGTLSTTQYIFGQRPDGTPTTSNSIFARFHSANTLITTVYSSSTSYAASTSATITDANWHHIAIVRYSGYLKIYIDGNESASESLGSVTINNSPNKFAIGRAGESTTTPFNGYIDEFRLSVGIARWTTAFTPPTSEYTA